MHLLVTPTATIASILMMMVLSQNVITLLLLLSSFITFLTPPFELEETIINWILLTVSLVEV